MDTTLANALVEELSKRPEISTPDNAHFANLLANTEVPDSSRFYVELPDNDKDRKLLDEGTAGYRYFSLRRVLRNKTEYAPISVRKKAWAAIAGAFGFYSSNVLTRRLRADKDLVDIMNKSEHPYSLLGKLERYDHGNPEQRLFVVTRPILVIPGAKDIARIQDWEKENTTYEEEKGLLIKQLTRIPQKEYIANHK